MTDAEVFQSLAELLAEQPGVSIPASQIQPKTALFEDGLDLDSFSVVNLIAHIEDVYGIEFHDDDFQPENFVDMAALSAMVRRYLTPDAAGPG